MGCKVVLVDKCDAFTRNNVLICHSVIVDYLKSIGEEEFRNLSGNVYHISKCCILHYNSEIYNRFIWLLTKKEKRKYFKCKGYHSKKQLLRPHKKTENNLLEKLGIPKLLIEIKKVIRMKPYQQNVGNAHSFCDACVLHFIRISHHKYTKTNFLWKIVINVIEYPFL